MNQKCPKCGNELIREIKSGLGGCYVYCFKCHTETPHVGFIDLARKIWDDPIWREREEEQSKEKPISILGPYDRS